MERVTEDFGPTGTRPATGYRYRGTFLYFVPSILPGIRGTYLAVSYPLPKVSLSEAPDSILARGKTLSEVRAEIDRARDGGTV